MTTPPLDLTALREYAKELERDGARSGTIRTDVLRALLNRVEEESERADRAAKAVHDQSAIIERLTTRAEAAERACQTLGRVIDRQCEDALTATDSQDLMWGNDGDGDWGAIWERVLGLGEKAREATARAEAAERDLAAVTVSRDGWQPRAEAAEKKVAAVREVHPRVVIAVHESHGVEAMCPQCQHHYPCPTITALDTPETETTP